MSTIQHDLDFCSFYLCVRPSFQLMAHNVGMRAQAYVGKKYSKSFLALIHAECVRLGSYEGMMLLFRDKYE